MSMPVYCIDEFHALKTSELPRDSPGMLPSAHHSYQRLTGLAFEEEEDDIDKELEEFKK